MSALVDDLRTFLASGPGEAIHDGEEISFPI
jgi:hypothetical protein